MCYRQNVTSIQRAPIRHKCMRTTEYRSLSSNMGVCRPATLAIYLLTCVNRGREEKSLEADAALQVTRRSGAIVGQAQITMTQLVPDNGFLYVNIST